MKRDLVGYGKIYPEWNGQRAAKLPSPWSSTTRRVRSSRRCMETRDTKLTERYRRASLRKRVAFRRKPSGNMEGEQGFGDCCACSSSTKSKQRFLPVPWRWNKTRPSDVRLLLKATMFAGTDCVGRNNGTLTAIAKRKAFKEPWC